jgi:electron transport complex protein RnfD
MPTTSPHTHSPRSAQVNRVMLDVLLALIPGIFMMTWVFGYGTLVNIVWASLLAVGFEAGVMLLRGRPPLFYIRDYSALVTAILLALAIPPYAPWWITLIGILFAIVVAKHLYGGLGFNPFNPAMVGYVVLLISFPVQMTQWPAPNTLLPQGTDMPSLLDAVALIFGSTRDAIDGLTGATALDVMRQNSGLLIEQLYAQTPLLNEGVLAAVGFEWVALAYLIGGIYLLARKVFTWHAPVGMLVSLFVLAALFYDGGSSASKGSPIFHLLSGATMMGAFFIVTDPVSGATSNVGRLIFGIGVGVLVFIIRAWGNYPDAVAFAVLLMNFAAPFIDYYTQPRTYGHDKRKRVKLMGGD